MRSRFKPAEREAFTVEWRNGSHWHTAAITGPIETDSLGMQFVPLRHTGKTTRTVSNGAHINGYPTGVRKGAPDA